MNNQMRWEQSASACANSRPAQDENTQILFRVPSRTCVCVSSSCSKSSSNRIKILLHIFIIFVPLLVLKHDAQGLVAGEVQPKRKRSGTHARARDTFSVYLGNQSQGGSY